MEPPEDSAEFHADPATAPTNGTSPQPVVPGADLVLPRRRSPVVTFLLVGTIVAVVAPFVALIIAAIVHAGPFGDRIFPVEMHNDTNQTLIVRLCGNNCTPAYQSVSLTPGATVEVGATIGQMTRYYLHSSSGTLLGCLPLDYRTQINNLTVEASQQEICPGNPLPTPSQRPTPS